MRFANRREAGEALAQRLTAYQDEDCVVYALPRGGVVLGLVIAEKLGCPLDLLIPRKVGHPHNSEYAIAAVTEHGGLVTNSDEVAQVDSEWFDRQVEVQRQEAARRRRIYLDGHRSVPATGRTAILVDDGIATGLTMEAAIADVKTQQPRRIVVAIPVAPADTVARLSDQVDEVITVDTPEYYLGAVGAYYADFTQVDDNEVIIDLERARRREPAHASGN